MRSVTVLPVKALPHASLFHLTLIYSSFHCGIFLFFSLCLQVTHCLSSSTLLPSVYMSFRLLIFLLPAASHLPSSWLLLSFSFPLFLLQFLHFFSSFLLLSCLSTFHLSCFLFSNRQACSNLSMLVVCFLFWFLHRLFFFFLNLKFSVIFLPFLRVWRSVAHLIPVSSHEQAKPSITSMLDQQSVLQSNNLIVCSKTAFTEV